jgi:hypothetical protein
MAEDSLCSLWKELTRDDYLLLHPDSYVLSQATITKRLSDYLQDENRQ